MSNLPALLCALKKLRSVSDPPLSLSLSLSIPLFRVSSRPFPWTSLYFRLYWKNECIDGAGWKERKVWTKKLYRSSRKKRRRKGEKNGKERRKRRKADELQSIHRIIQIPWSMGKESLSPSPCCVEWNKRRYSDHIRIRAYNAQGLSLPLSRGKERRRVYNRGVRPP